MVLSRATYESVNPLNRTDGNIKEHSRISKISPIFFQKKKRIWNGSMLTHLHKFRQEGQKHKSREKEERNITWDKERINMEKSRLRSTEWMSSQ